MASGTGSIVTPGKVFSFNLTILSRLRIFALFVIPYRNLVHVYAGFRLIKIKLPVVIASVFIVCVHKLAY